MEIHRVCKDGARVSILTPHYSGPSAWCCLQHRRGFGYYTLDSFSTNRKMANSMDLDISEGEGFFQISSHFKFHRLHNLLGVAWFANRFPSFYEAYLAGIFPAWEIQYFLKVVK